MSRPAFPAASPAAVLAACLVTCLLAACATPYQQQGFTGTGYVESWRGDDKVVITYEGNLSTRPAVAEDMAMLRAAELAIERGFTHFAIRRAGEVDQTLHLQQQRTLGPGEYIFPYAAFGTEGGGTGGGTLYKRGARIYVVMLRNPPADLAGVLDARIVQGELSRLYPRTERGTSAP
jgi:hypothetical protein